MDIWYFDFAKWWWREIKVGRESNPAQQLCLPPGSVAVEADSRINIVNPMTGNL